jgi:hypothetical protein
VSNVEDEWSTRFPFAPAWVGHSVVFLKSFPVQVIGRVIAIFPTLAWILICGAVPLAIASIFALKVPNSTLAVVLLVMIAPLVIYSAIVVIKVRVRLAHRAFREDESLLLAILDESTFLGWGVTVSVTQMFRLLNLLFTAPLRLAFSSPRAIRWTICVLILAAVIVMGWSLLPIKFIPWANQYGRGVITSGSVGGLFALATITIVGLLLLTILFFGFWAEMLALGGSVVLAATMVSAELPRSLSSMFDPLIAWSQWMPPGMRPILDESSDFHPYLTGPGDVTPFGMLSIAVVFHGIPFALKKINVKMLPGEGGIAPDDREEMDNATGWWLRVVAVLAVFELPMIFALLSRSTALVDPKLPPVGNGGLAVVGVLAALGGVLLYRLFRTKHRSIGRPSDFIDGLTIYVQRCLR